MGIKSGLLKSRYEAGTGQVGPPAIPISIFPIPACTPSFPTFNTHTYTRCGGCNASMDFLACPSFKWKWSWKNNAYVISHRGENRSQCAFGTFLSKVEYSFEGYKIVAWQSGSKNIDRSRDMNFSSNWAKAFLLSITKCDASTSCYKWIQGTSLDRKLAIPENYLRNAAKLHKVHLVNWVLRQNIFGGGGLKIWTYLVGDNGFLCSTRNPSASCHFLESSKPIQMKLHCRPLIALSQNPDTLVVIHL